MSGIPLRSEGVKDNLKKTSDLCGLYPYSLIMRENGVNLNEKELFALLKLFSIECYFVKDGKRCNTINPACDAFCLTGIKPFYESSFNGLTNIRFCKIKIFDQEDANEKIFHYIKQNKKVIAFVDVYYLNYHPLQRRYHGQTQIIIHKYEGDCFFISDHHLPTFPVSHFEGWIPRKELMEALLFGDNNEQSEITGIISYSIGEEQDHIGFDLKKLIDDNFEEYITEHFNQCFDIKKQITDSLNMLYQLNDSEYRKKLFVSAYTHLTGRAGIVISRKIMAELQNDLGYTANRFGLISEMWQGIAGGFFRLSKKFSQNDFKELNAKINKVIDVEQDEIYKWRENWTL